MTYASSVQMPTAINTIEKRIMLNLQMGNNMPEKDPIHKKTNDDLRIIRQIKGEASRRKKEQWEIDRIRFQKKEYEDNNRTLLHDDTEGDIL